MYGACGVGLWGEGKDPTRCKMYTGLLGIRTTRKSPLPAVGPSSIPSDEHLREFRLGAKAGNSVYLREVLRALGINVKLDSDFSILKTPFARKSRFVPRRFGDHVLTASTPASPSVFLQHPVSAQVHRSRPPSARTSTKDARQGDHSSGRLVGGTRMTVEICFRPANRVFAGVGFWGEKHLHCGALTQHGCGEMRHRCERRWRRRRL